MSTLGNLSEPLLLVLLGLGGVTFLLHVGVVRIGWLVGLAPLSLGFIALITFPLVSLLGVTTLPVVVASILVSLAMALTNHAKRTALCKASVFLVPMAVFSWVLRVPFQLPERSGEDAILVLMQAVTDIQIGEFPSDPRRGWAYPLLIGLSGKGEILPSMTTLIVICGFGLVLVIAGEVASRAWYGPFAPVVTLAAAVIFSTPIVWIFLAYSNSHSLMFLALTGIFGICLAGAHNLASIEGAPAAVAVCALVAAVTRFEGAFLVFLTLLPQLVTTSGESDPRNKVLWAALGGAGIGLTGWSVLEPAWATTFVTGFVALSGLTLIATTRAPHWFSLLTSIPFLGVAIATTLGITLVVHGPEWMVLILRALFANFVAGASGWGVLLPASLLLFSILRLRSRSRVTLLAGWTVIWGLVVTFLLKVLDSPPMNIGFNDSLSRTFFHWFGVLALLWIIGMMELFEDTNLGKLHQRLPVNLRVHLSKLRHSSLARRIGGLSHRG